MITIPSGPLLTKLELDALNELRNRPEQKILFGEQLDPQITKALNRLQKKDLVRFTYVDTPDGKRGLKADAWELAEKTGAA